MLASGNSATNLKPFIITVSARVLFDLEESHRVYEKEGLEAFEKYQAENINIPLQPGPIFSLVQKLLAFNEKLPEGVRPFEVVLLSRNSTDTALRVMDSIEHLGLPFIRAVFTGGEPSSTYIDAIGADLFLSSNPEEVAKAVNEAKIAGATISGTSSHAFPSHETQIRIAFDGDSVLFSDEAERVYGDGGLEAFQSHEHENADLPLKEGPFRGFLEAIHAIQKAFPKNKSPIRTALITARSFPAHRRAINTLRSWGVEVNEAMFLGGKKKAPFLKAFKADLFFDDSKQNIQNALEVMPAGHVPFGVRNEETAVDGKFSGGEEVRSTAFSEASSVSVAPPLAPRPRVAALGGRKPG